MTKRTGSKKGATIRKLRPKTNRNSATPDKTPGHSSTSLSTSSLILSDDEKGAAAVIGDKLMTELLEHHLTDDPHYAAVFAAAFVQQLLAEGWRFETV